MRHRAILMLLLLALPSALVRAEDSTAPFIVPKDVQAVITNRCLDCHSGAAAEGEVRFDQMEQLSTDVRLELLNRAQEQLFFGLMPPQEDDTPEESESSLLVGWIHDELQKHNASKLDEKLRYPDYGNYVDHEKLFSGEIGAKAYTPARRWLVSPLIFEERVLDIFELEARERDHLRRQGFYGVTNPFVLPDKSGVRDYDITVLDGGHLLVMLTNADWISTKQIRAALVKKGALSANEFENPKDRWYPKMTPEAFEKIILKDSEPSDAEIIDAIYTQFDCVLQRKASDEEMARYLKLTRAAIELGGNTEGLRQMLVAVLLESEFLYRLEFGAGEPDAYGRRKISPREASYAISYALGERNPDAELIKAADEERLNTREDFQREVLRLLADENFYRGQVDKSLNGMHFQSHVTAHPRIIRFFREFFGYPNAVKVFKDINRSGGYYNNPDRGTTASPGWLVNEADEIVIWYVERDENLFKNLLTTEKFFVYHNMDTKTGLETIADWKHVYESLRNSEWKTDPEKVLAENLDLLKSAKTLRITDVKQKKDLQLYMHYFEDTFGKGGTPFPRGPWTHGFYYNHSPSYNLPELPSRWRYQFVDTKQFKELDDAEFWDYPIEQPFKIEHRKGILTHPAWLIAHSQNAATDPVRRGRWIREKLLAGRVPDVPITVDAQIPEDPHYTLRERLELVTTKQECWKCHQHMNPLGVAFEMYDDFGRFRTEESLEHPDNLIKKTQTKYGADTYKAKSVNTTGNLSGTGDQELDGEVRDAIDLIDKLAKSERVRQSIIRHAFRFYLGRNELLSDSQTLIDAEKAYIESGGSFKAVIVSLLTSDSFIYRKEIKD